MKIRNIVAAGVTLLFTACAHHLADQVNVPKQTTGESVVIRPTKLDRILNGFVEDGRLVGASALIYQEGKEVYFGAYGKASRETGQQMSRDTLVQIYSMTKPIVGVALMTLYEQGKFELHDPIAKYVPELANLKLYAGTDKGGRELLKTPDRQPTVLDFMRHTAGLGEGGSPAPVGELWRTADPMSLDNTLAEVAKEIGRIPLLKQPGEVWRYGPSVEMQALMIERLSGRPLADFLQDTIFSPLGMTQTSYFVAPDDRDRFAQMYIKQEDGAIVDAPAHFSTAVNFKRWARSPGSFGLVSTLDDYMRFAQMLVNGGSLEGVQIIQPATLAIMTKDYLGSDITDRAWLHVKGRVGFGLDFAVRTGPPQSSEEMYGVVGEFFWDGLATTIFWVDPINKLTVVFFTQLIPHQDDIHKQLRDAVYDVAPPEQAKQAQQ